VALDPKVRAEAKIEIRAQSFEDSKEVRQAVFAAASYLGYNPRKMKRFINLFKLQVKIADRRRLLEKQAIELAKLGGWLTIRMRWPDAIDAVVEDQDFPSLLLRAYGLQLRLLNFYEDLEKRGLKTGSPEAEEARKELEGKLEPLLLNPRVKQFHRDSDLVLLLDEMSGSDSSVSPYLSLTRVTASDAISP
jgi:hypothetical protein